jgi:hypothetical protein
VRTVLLWTAQPKALAYSMLRSVLVGGDDCYHLGNSGDCGWVAALLRASGALPTIEIEAAGLIVDVKARIRSTMALELASDSRLE